MREKGDLIRASMNCSFEDNIDEWYDMISLVLADVDLVLGHRGFDLSV